MASSSSLHGYNIIAKPTGPACNLDCRYCFYKEKEALYAGNDSFRMTEEVLEAFIRKYIESQSLPPEVTFVWQGGEPALMGLDFYREAVRLQKKCSNGRQINNSFQTNGMLLDDSWCEFMKCNNFLVGISIDGPEDIHNYYRIDHSGRPTFETVMRGLELLKKHGVEFNILACVTRQNVKRPLDTYRFFKEQGIRFIQFIPVIERQPDLAAEELGLQLAPPPVSGQEDSTQVTEWSVEPAAYGDFLIKIFNDWVRTDVGSVFVMNFEWALASWMNSISPACTFSEICGRCLVIEHNGDVYSCDHYVYPEYRLGNILNDELEQMVESEKQIQFGRGKEANLSAQCRKCDFLFACHGDCPKHRFMDLRKGRSGISYLCNGYKRFFKHIDPYMNKIRQLLKQGKPAKMIMDLSKKTAIKDVSR